MVGERGEGLDGPALSMITASFGVQQPYWIANAFSGVRLSGEVLGGVSLPGWLNKIRESLYAAVNSHSLSNIHGRLPILK